MNQTFSQIGQHNKRHSLSFIPQNGGNILTQRIHRSTQIESFNQQIPARHVSQNSSSLQKQQQQLQSNALNPYQIVSPIFQNQISQQMTQINFQQLQCNPNSARISPRRVLSSQRGNHQPTSGRVATNSYQQDQYGNQNMQQIQSLVQSFQPSNTIRLVGGQQGNLTTRRESSQSPQPQYPQQRFQSFSNHINGVQMVNENQININKRNSLSQIPVQLLQQPISSQYQTVKIQTQPAPIQQQKLQIPIQKKQIPAQQQPNIAQQSQIPVQQYESQQNIQQINQKKYMSPIQLTNYNLMQPEIQTPLTQNQQSFQNIDEFDERKRSVFDSREDPFNFIQKVQSPVFASQNPSVGLFSQQQQQQQSAQQETLKLQNITNNVTLSKKFQAPKPRTYSSIQFQKSIENQENTNLDQELFKSQNQNSINNNKKTFEPQILKSQYNNNIQIIDQHKKQQRYESVLRETKQNQQQFNTCLQQKQETPINNYNNRYQSHQIIDHSNTFQIGQSSSIEQSENLFINVKDQFQGTNQNINFSMFNSEFMNNNQESISIHSTNNENNNKPNSNNSLDEIVQQQQDLQELTYSSKSFYRSNNEKEVQDCIGLENNPEQQQQNINRIDNDVKNLFQKEKCKMGKDMEKYEAKQNDSYKLKIQQLQEENDKLQDQNKYLNEQLDEQTHKLNDAENKLSQTEQSIIELEENADTLMEENQKIKRQVQELNQVINQQKTIESRCYILEEKVQFYEEQLTFLRQQEKQKSNILINVQDSLLQIYDSEEIFTKNSSEQCVLEMVNKFIEKINEAKMINQKLTDEIDQKIKTINQYEQEIQSQNEKMSDYGIIQEKLQNIIESQKEQEELQYQTNIINNFEKDQLEQLKLELNKTKQELSSIDDIKKIEISLLHKELDSQQQKITDLTLQLIKQESVNDTLQGPTDKFYQTKMTDQEKQIQDLTSLNSLYMNQVDDLQSQHSKCYLLKAENETLKYQNDNFTFQIKNKESEIRQFQMKLEISQNEWSNLQTNYELQLSDKGQQINMLQSQVDKSQNQMDKQQQDIHQKNDSSDTQKQQQQEIHKLKQESDQLRAQLLNLENENREMMIENQNLNKSQQKFQQEIYILKQLVDNQGQNLLFEQNQYQQNQIKQRSHHQTEHSKSEFEFNDQSGAQNIESIMNAFSCQTIKTIYSKQF